MRDDEATERLRFSPASFQTYLDAKLATEVSGHLLALAFWCIPPIESLVATSAVAICLRLVRLLRIGSRPAHIKCIRWAYRAAVGGALSSILAIPAFILTYLRRTRSSLRQLQDSARRHHQIALKAIEDRAYILVLRDFGEEKLYDASSFFYSGKPLVEGLLPIGQAVMDVVGMNMRRELFRDIAEKVGPDLTAVTLVNPHDSDALSRLDTGVHHLFVEPTSWPAAVRFLITHASQILLTIPTGKVGSGLALELGLLDELGRLTDSLAIVRDPDSIEHENWRSGLRIVSEGEFLTAREL